MIKKEKTDKTEEPIIKIEEEVKMETENIDVTDQVIKEQKGINNKLTSAQAHNLRMRNEWYLIVSDKTLLHGDLVL